MADAQPPHNAVDDGRSVVLSIPAQHEQLPIIRLLTEAVAMRNDCTLDQAADLKLAVDQICTLLIAAAAPGAGLVCHYTADEHTFEAAITATTAADWRPEDGSLEWRILRALAGTLSVSQHPTDSQLANETTVVVRTRKPL
ncbi:anti-sigma factor [Speluncibacter jeojiensis]|uniref:ATP-binding protein n=1 Tax=Speluncibacter jeojiensis TaxID=2710754 RepID=A0A9X4M272_9ACTN|nr:ATP-binding protein [Corynebacteriales bacterium D3-21]